MKRIAIIWTNGIIEPQGICVEVLENVRANYWRTVCVQWFPLEAQCRAFALEHGAEIEIH